MVGENPGHRLYKSFGYLRLLAYIEPGPQAALRRLRRRDLDLRSLSKALPEIPRGQRKMPYILTGEKRVGEWPATLTEPEEQRG